VTALAMAHFKGGTAKTSTAVNLSASLAREGRKVLLVDCDPQANASETFIDESEITGTLRTVIRDQVPVQKVIQATRIGGLWVLPSAFELAILANELVVSYNGVQRIEKALRPVRGDFDDIVFDTGPNLSPLTLGALVAAEQYIIPVSAAVWSMTALYKFVGWIEEQRRDEVIEATLMGLLATMVGSRTRIGDKVVAEIRASAYPSFDTVIPRRVGAEDAVANKAVAGDPEMNPDLNEAYKAFAAEVVGKMPRKRGGAHRAITEQ
jgi:chromosome partitioning protein